MRKTILGLAILFIASFFPNDATAMCGGPFGQEGPVHFGYVLLFSSDTSTTLNGSPAFYIVIGPNDRLQHTVLSATVAEPLIQDLMRVSPAKLAVVANVQVRGDFRVIHIVRVLKNSSEVLAAKTRSEFKYGGTCGSSFSSAATSA
jgi:hypothetical protein